MPFASVQSVNLDKSRLDRSDKPLGIVAKMVVSAAVFKYRYFIILSYLNARQTPLYGHSEGNIESVRIKRVMLLK